MLVQKKEPLGGTTYIRNQTTYIPSGIPLGQCLNTGFIFLISICLSMTFYSRRLLHKHYSELCSCLLVYRVSIQPKLADPTYWRMLKIWLHTSMPGNLCTSYLKTTNTNPNSKSIHEPSTRLGTWLSLAFTFTLYSNSISSPAPLQKGLYTVDVRI